MTISVPVVDGRPRAPTVSRSIVLPPYKAEPPGRRLAYLLPRVGLSACEWGVGVALIAYGVAAAVYSVGQRRLTRPPFDLELGLLVVVSLVLGALIGVGRNYPRYQRQLRRRQIESFLIPYDRAARAHSYELQHFSWNIQDPALQARVGDSLTVKTFPMVRMLIAYAVGGEPDIALIRRENLEWDLQEGGVSLVTFPQAYYALIGNKATLTAGDEAVITCSRRDVERLMEDASRLATDIRTQVVYGPDTLMDPGGDGVDSNGRQ